MRPHITFYSGNLDLWPWNFDLDLQGRPLGHLCPCYDQILLPWVQLFLRYEFCSNHRLTYSDAFESMVHTHMSVPWNPLSPGHKFWMFPHGMTINDLGRPGGNQKFKRNPGKITFHGSFSKEKIISKYPPSSRKKILKRVSQEKIKSIFDFWYIPCWSLMVDP